MGTEVLFEKEKEALSEKEQIALNKKSENILDLKDYLYEEAFALDREVIGEDAYYVRFLNYAYDRLIDFNSKDLRSTMREYIRNTILSCDSLTVQMLYDNFYTVLEPKEKEKVKIIRMKKVV